MSQPEAKPWKGAEIHEGTIPQQAMLYPRPVLLECQDCGRAGYWYPDENKIDTGSRMCPIESVWRPFHMWDVLAWNGHDEVQIEHKAMVARLRELPAFKAMRADEAAARPGPGQAEDNYVHMMECGHEHDDAKQLPIGHVLFCSMHGLTRITGN